MRGETFGGANKLKTEKQIKKNTDASVTKN